MQSDHSVTIQWLFWWTYCSFNNIYFWNFVERWQLPMLLNWRTCLLNRSDGTWRNLVNSEVKFESSNRNRHNGEERVSVKPCAGLDVHSGDRLIEFPERNLIKRFKSPQDSTSRALAARSASSSATSRTNVQRARPSTCKGHRERSCWRKSGRIKSGSCWSQRSTARSSEL